MSDEQMETGDITERFRAFAQSADPEPSRARRMALLVAGPVILITVAALLVIMLGW